jgi:hypothetical protein
MPDDAEAWKKWSGAAGERIWVTTLSNLCTGTGQSSERKECQIWRSTRFEMSQRHANIRDADEPVTGRKGRVYVEIQSIRFGCGRDRRLHRDRFG